MKRITVLAAAIILLWAGRAAGQTELFEKLPRFYGEPQLVFNVDNGRRPVIYVARQVAGDISELVEADLVTGEAVVLLPGIEYDARLLAIDDRYAVLMKHGPAQFTTFKVYALDSGDVVAKKRLKNGAVAAAISGDRLRLIQIDFSGPKTDFLGAVFDIETLEFQQEKRWVFNGSFSPHTGDPRTLFLRGRHGADEDRKFGIAEIDYDANPVRWIPNPSAGGGRTCNHSVAASCWQIDSGNYYTIDKEWLHAIDLATNEPLFSIENETGRFHAIAVKHGLVFAAQGGYNDGERLIKVFGGNDGRLLATLPISVARVAFAGDYLVVTHDVYALDWQRLGALE